MFIITRRARDWFLLAAAAAALGEGVSLAAAAGDDSKDITEERDSKQPDIFQDLSFNEFLALGTSHDDEDDTDTLSSFIQLNNKRRSDKTWSDTLQQLKEATAAAAEGFFSVFNSQKETRNPEEEEEDDDDATIGTVASASATNRTSSKINTEGFKNFVAGIRQEVATALEATGGHNNSKNEAAFLSDAAYKAQQQLRDVYSLLNRSLKDVVSLALNNPTLQDLGQQLQQQLGSLGTLSERDIAICMQGILALALAASLTSSPSATSTEEKQKSLLRLLISFLTRLQESSNRQKAQQKPAKHKRRRNLRASRHGNSFNKRHQSPEMELLDNLLREIEEDDINVEFAETQDSDETESEQSATEETETGDDKETTLSSFFLNSIASLLDGKDNDGILSLPASAPKRRFHRSNRNRP